jgi:hypothetical protein
MSLREYLLPLSSLCDKCRAEWEAWLDYREPRQVQIVTFAAYDATPAGVADNRRARDERRRETVLFHQKLIVRICAGFHGRPVERLAVAGSAL